MRRKTFIIKTFKKTFTLKTVMKHLFRV